MNINIRLLVLLALSVAMSFSFSSVASFIFDPEELLIDLDLALNKENDQPSPIDWIFMDVIPQFIGMRPYNENGTRSQFKAHSMKDKSNDDLYKMSITELIRNSGFESEEHECIADDGYVTGLYRLINPRADPSKLRYPPIIMEHGGTINPTAYFIGSSKQHQPEPWPRTRKDGPFTSSNRSLGFTLANFGFDVWLAETRGANDKFRKKVKGVATKTILQGRNERKNMTVGEDIREVFNEDDYWSFTLDDIIAHELKSHIDCVMRLTAAHQVHLLTFSLSTPTSLAFLSVRPDYTEKIRGFISMSPIISGDDLGPVLKLFLTGICPMLPSGLTTLVLSDILLKQPTRDFLVTVAGSKYLRYLLIKCFINIIFGPSAKWETLLELNMLGHLLQQVGFKEVKQLCQQTRANKLQKFDFGPIKNKLIYNSTEPPVYDLSKITMKDWIIVSGANDAIATMKQVKRLIEMLRPENRPIAHIVAAGYNHLDMLGGVEVDRYINLPIVNYLIQMSDEYDSQDSQQQRRRSTGRGLDLTSVIPDNSIVEEAVSNISSNLNPDFLMSFMQKAIMDIILQISGTSSSDSMDSDLKTTTKTSDEQLLANQTGLSD